MKKLGKRSQSIERTKSTGQDILIESAPVACSEEDKCWVYSRRLGVDGGVEIAVLNDIMGRVRRLTNNEMTVECRRSMQAQIEEF